MLCITSTETLKRSLEMKAAMHICTIYGAEVLMTVEIGALTCLHGFQSQSNPNEKTKIIKKSFVHVILA